LGSAVRGGDANNGRQELQTADKNCKLPLV